MFYSPKQEILLRLIINELQMNFPKQEILLRLIINELDV
jgi:hypothetical protein